MASRVATCKKYNSTVAWLGGAISTGERCRLFTGIGVLRRVKNLRESIFYLLGLGEWEEERGMGGGFKGTWFTQGDMVRRVGTTEDMKNHPYW